MINTAATLLRIGLCAQNPFFFFFPGLLVLLSLQHHHHCETEPYSQVWCVYVLEDSVFLELICQSIASNAFPFFMLWELLFCLNKHTHTVLWMLWRTRHQSADHYRRLDRGTFVSRHHSHSVFTAQLNMAAWSPQHRCLVWDRPLAFGVSLCCCLA